MNEKEMIEEIDKIHKEVMFEMSYSRKSEKSLFRQWYEMFGLPFKLHDDKGKEIIMLELNEKEEQEIVNKIDKMFNKMYDVWKDSILYGVGKWEI